MRRTLIAGAVVLAVAAASAVFLVRRSAVSATFFTSAQIQAATRRASGESTPSVQDYLTRETTSGHSVRAEDVNVADVRSTDGGTTARIVWTGSRTPAALLVASRSGSGLAVGLTATTPTGLPTSPLPATVNRQAYGGATAEGELKAVRSDCIEVWVTVGGVTSETLSCAELWHGSPTTDWIYHHFAQRQSSTAMSIRSRIVPAQRADVTGPQFVASCSDSGRTSVVAGPVKNAQGVSNPSIQMRSNPCTGFHDLINQADQQTGAKIQGGMSAETTGTYTVSESNISPAWDDYVWSQSGPRAIDESKYLAWLWPGN